jgi:hypothetical protein
MMILLMLLHDFCVQSSAVADAAYNVQWYNHSTKFKKLLQMVIMRAQRPCLIKLGPFCPNLMEHYQNVSLVFLCKFMIFFFFCELRAVVAVGWLQFVVRVVFLGLDVWV